jgi:hypothetical protein
MSGMLLRSILIAGFCSLGVAVTCTPRIHVRSVVLPESAAKETAHFCSRPGPGRFDGTWTPTKTDVNAMEAQIEKISKLQIQGDKGTQIDHPDQYYRQYVGIILRKQKLIYINAICEQTLQSDPHIGKFWKTHVLIVCDDGKCGWGVIYDTATGVFSDLQVDECLCPIPPPKG